MGAGFRFRKRPVEIEAVRYLPKDSEQVERVMQFLEDCEGWHMSDHDEGGIVIPTLEGDHRAAPGDYIIRGVAGEFYPCKPDIFEQTYDPVPLAPPDEFDVPLTREQIDILLSITGPRVASPDAERLGDWSVDLDRRLRAALEVG